MYCVWYTVACKWKWLKIHFQKLLNVNEIKWCYFIEEIECEPVTMWTSQNGVKCLLFYLLSLSLFYFTLIKQISCPLVCHWTQRKWREKKKWTLWILMTMLLACMHLLNTKLIVYLYLPLHKNSTTVLFAARSSLCMCVCMVSHWTNWNIWKIVYLKLSTNYSY